MKVILIAFFCISGIVYSQEVPAQEELPTTGMPNPTPTVEEAPPQPENGIYTYVDEPAAYRGGREALSKFLGKNMRYPQTAVEAEIQGKVFLRFVVTKKGTITDVKVVKGIPGCPECDAEAVRVVEKMPKWIPGTINGQKVDSYFNLPLSFKLQ